MKNIELSLVLSLFSILCVIGVLWPKKKSKKTPSWFHDEARKNADFFDKK
jgi:hypothetical protein